MSKLSYILQVFGVVYIINNQALEAKLVDNNVHLKKTIKIPILLTYQELDNHNAN